MPLGAAHTFSNDGDDAVEAFLEVHPGLISRRAYVRSTAQPRSGRMDPINFALAARLATRWAADRSFPSTPGHRQLGILADSL